METEKTLWNGGNKVAFVSGGTGIDAIRNMAGRVTNEGDSAGFFNAMYGVFTSDGFWAHAIGGNYGSWMGGFLFNASRVVPTATDNRVRTAATRIWRRIA